MIPTVNLNYFKDNLLYQSGGGLLPQCSLYIDYGTNCYKIIFYLDQIITIYEYTFDYVVYLRGCVGVRGHYQIWVKNIGNKKEKNPYREGQQESPGGNAWRLYTCVLAQGEVLRPVKA